MERGRNCTLKNEIIVDRLIEIDYSTSKGMKTVFESYQDIFTGNG
jgi:hypothetical protein